MHDKFALYSVEQQKLSNFKKSLIRPGTYIHPQDSWEMTVDDSRLQQFLSTFQEMKKNGVRVPVLTSHSFEPPTSENCIGYLEDMYLDDDGWLSAVHGLTGSGVEYAERVGQVSIGIEKDYRDGLGNKYGEAITHVALTPIPVVPGQGGFEKIAASRDFAVLALSQEINNREVTSMLNQNETKRLSQLLGQEVTSDDFITIIEEKLGVIEQAKELEEKYSMSLKKIEDLEKRTVANVDAEVLEDRAQLYSERINQLALSGKVPEDVAKSLAEVLCGTEENRCALSLNTNGGREKCFAKAVIELLEQIPPRVEFGVKTGSQADVLSSKGKDGKGFDENIHNQMLKYAGITN